MHCRNCNRKIPEGEKKCPFCNVDTENSEIRCPDCWARLEKGEKICPKCGIDIEEAKKARQDIATQKKSGFTQRIKKLPRSVKIGMVSLVVIVCVAVASISYFLSQSAISEAASLAEDYIVFADEAMKDINELALLYENDVYNEDWILHIESAKELREKNADKFKKIKATREPMEYFQARIRQTECKEYIEYSDDMFYSYQKCYAYVVGEVGKYPHYYDNFKKLLAEYEKAEKELRKLIK